MFYNKLCIKMFLFPKKISKPEEVGFIDEVASIQSMANELKG